MSRDCKVIATEQVDAAIGAAGTYLVRQCGASGRFEYRRNLDASVPVRPKYNLVRHAGALYALACFHAVTGDDATRNAVGRAARFLRGHIAPISGAPLRYAVWSRPEFEGHRRPTQCKLGAAGLALAALGRARTIDPGCVEATALSALAEFVVFMQQDSGEFYAKYFPGRRERSNAWQSLYYPGEAALGLLAAYRCDANPRWLVAAGRGLEYLARSRQGVFPVAADHWALLATAEYLQHQEIRTDDPPAEALLQHTVAVCKSMLHEQSQSGGDAPDRGWFTADGRTTPTATRLEGLLAALQCLPEKSGLREALSRSIAAGMQFLMRSQIQTGPWRGAIPRVSPEAHAWPSAGATEDPRAGEVRIDYVQHALCALLQWRYSAHAPQGAGSRC